MIVIRKYNRLYNDEVIFQFYSNSRDAKPGKGSGESIKPERVKDFTDLQLKENKNWRKVLSNFIYQSFS